MRETDVIGGFAKGLRVIEVFGEAKPRLTITDVSKETGLDRATARRCLLTLAELGYAAYDGKFFELTPKILRLGHAYLSATPLPRLVQPHLDRLSETVGQSTSVSVLDGTEIVYVARAAQKRVMSISLMPGSRLPAYCASMGRVLLAALPEAEARAITCPTCGSAQVKKAPMAPAILRCKGKTKEAESPAAVERRRTYAFLKGLRAHLKENADDVGRAFPEEARKMHYGEAETRDIYGEATADEAKALHEEGIPAVPLPRLPEEHN